MKKTLNALLICGSFSISNAQTVLNSLDVIPYIFDGTLVVTRPTTDEECKLSQGYLPGNAEITGVRRGESWVSNVDARDKALNSLRNTREDIDVVNLKCGTAYHVTNADVVQWEESTYKGKSSADGIPACPVRKNTRVDGWGDPDFVAKNRRYIKNSTSVTPYEYVTETIPICYVWSQFQADGNFQHPIYENVKVVKFKVRHIDVNRVEPGSIRPVITNWRY